MIEEIQTISDQLRQVPDDLGGQVNYLQNLCNLKWAISDILPQAKAMYNEKYAQVSEKVLNEYSDKKVAISVLTGIIKAGCKTEQKLVDMCDRINSTINLHSQNLRTIISFKKGGGV